MAQWRIGEHMFSAPNRENREYERVIYQPGVVTRIILNRPRYRNAMSHPLLFEMEDAFDRAAADPSPDDRSTRGVTMTNQNCIADFSRPSTRKKMGWSKSQCPPGRTSQHNHFLMVFG